MNDGLVILGSFNCTFKTELMHIHLTKSQPPLFFLIYYIGGSDFGEDAPELCVSARLIYKFRSFNLEPVRVSRCGRMASSTSLLSILKSYHAKHRCLANTGFFVVVCLN